VDRGSQALNRLAPVQLRRSAILALVGRLSLDLEDTMGNTIDLSAIIERAEERAERESVAEERRRIMARAEVASRRIWQTCLLADSD
jgi:hypothetical protein